MLTDKFWQGLLRHFIFGHRSTQLFLRGLRKAVNVLPDTNAKSTIQSIKKQAKEIQQFNRKVVKDSASLGHLEFVSHILAAYRILLPIVGSESATLQFLKAAMMQGFDIWSLRISLRYMLYSCRRNPDRLRNIFSWMMKQYGTTFTWSVPHIHDEKHCQFSINITRCFYCEFFKINDAEFLTQLLCQLDAIWFEMISPDKHKFYFDKANYQTQGYGAKKCIFPIQMRF